VHQYQTCHGRSRRTLQSDSYPRDCQQVRCRRRRRGRRRASGLHDGGVSVDQVDAKQGGQYVARIFGGNDRNAVASALAGSGAGGNDLIKRLLPILAPIVLAYIGKQLTQKSAAPAGGGATQTQAAPSGGLGDVLGGILGGNQGNAIGEILGGLLGGKK
jgi:hypothetical protein